MPIVAKSELARRAAARAAAVTSPARESAPQAMPIVADAERASPNAEPSNADVELTRALGRAARTMGIALYDHLVVGLAGRISLRQRGII